MDNENRRALEERGFVYDDLTSSLTVLKVVGNNCTQLRCTVRPNGVTAFSEPVKLTLAGKVLHNHIIVNKLCQLLI